MRLYLLFAAFSPLLLLECGSARSKPSATNTSNDASAIAESPDAALGQASDAGLGQAPDVGTAVTQLDGAPSTKLPPLPELTNVVATEREDSVAIDFDPVDNAVDYRVYPLPSDNDITVQSDGSLIIKNAVYRCAGVRQTFDLPNNTSNAMHSTDAGQSYYNGQFSWSAQVQSSPILGYVYVTPGPDRQPVYAVGVHASQDELGWRESRPKIYTTDATARQTLLGQGGRDDGIVFYVPSAASSATQTIYHSEAAVALAQSNSYTRYTEYYFTSSDLGARSKDKTPPAPAFEVLSQAASDAQPLFATFYQPDHYHTELSVGHERFTRAANQGPGPLWHLEWSGITQSTTLVIEALSTGCPYQGFLSAQHLDAPPHQTFETPTDLQNASSTGEAYINGQYDPPGTQRTVLGAHPDGGISYLHTPNASPIPIARSFIQVSPQPHDPSAWDWYQGFSPGSDLGTLTKVSPCLENGARGFNCGEWQSPVFDISSYRLDIRNNVTTLTYGQLLGQLWVAFDDSGGDVTGKVRLGALQMAQIDADPNKFLHVTWSVTMVGSDRRYPQLLVSDQPPPVQEGLNNPNNNTLIVQSILGPSMRIEAQAIHGLVHGVAWDVNNQSPHHSIIDYDTWRTGNVTTMPPNEPPLEHAGMDQLTRFDAYISSDRVYVFMDGTAAGCTQYPSGTGFVLSGSVSVTFGDVLYHEGAEGVVCQQVRPFPFLYQHQCTETQRHWDDLAFKNGVAAPAWDSTNFPCAAF